MKANLAAQAFSSSVADAIEYCTNTPKLPQFQGSEATVQFIRLFYRLFLYPQLPKSLCQRIQVRTSHQQQSCLGSISRWSMPLHYWTKRYIWKAHHVYHPPKNRLHWIPPGNQKHQRNLLWFGWNQMCLEVQWNEPTAWNFVDWSGSAVLLLLCNFTYMYWETSSKEWY